MGVNYIMFNRTKKNYAYFGKSALFVFGEPVREDDKQSHKEVLDKLALYLLCHTKDELMFLPTDLCDVFDGPNYKVARWLGISDEYEFKLQYTEHELSYRQ